MGSRATEASLQGSMLNSLWQQEAPTPVGSVSGPSRAGKDISLAETGWGICLAVSPFGSGAASSAALLLPSGRPEDPHLQASGWGVERA